MAHTVRLGDARLVPVTAACRRPFRIHRAIEGVNPTVNNGGRPVARRHAGFDHVVVGAPGLVGFHSAAEADVPGRRGQKCCRHLIENGAVGLRRRGSARVALCGPEDSQRLVNFGGGELREVLTIPLAIESGLRLEELLQEHVWVSGWQRVLCPEQQVEALRAIGPRAAGLNHVFATVVFPHSSSDAQARELFLDDGGHRHEVGPEFVVDQIQTQLLSALGADTVDERPASLVEQTPSFNGVSGQWGVVLSPHGVRGEGTRGDRGGHVGCSHSWWRCRLRQRRTVDHQG